MLKLVSHEDNVKNVDTSFGEKILLSLFVVIQTAKDNTHLSEKDVVLVYKDKNLHIKVHGMDSKNHYQLLEYHVKLSQDIQ